MKYLFSLITLLICATVCYSQSLQNARQRNVYVGEVLQGDHLLGRRVATQTGRPTMVISQIVRFYATRNRKISAVRAQENGWQNPTASIVEGGIGHNNVSIELKSALGYGFKYTVEIYER